MSNLNSLDQRGGWFRPKRIWDTNLSNREFFDSYQPMHSWMDKFIWPLVSYPTTSVRRQALQREWKRECEYFWNPNWTVGLSLDKRHLITFNNGKSGKELCRSFERTTESVGREFNRWFRVIKFNKSSIIVTKGHSRALKLSYINIWFLLIGHRPYCQKREGLTRIWNKISWVVALI